MADPLKKQRAAYVTTLAAISASDEFAVFQAVQL